MNNLENTESTQFSEEKNSDTETFELTDEELIEKLEKRKEEIKKSSGRKMTFKCYGEKVTVPRRLRSEYENCCKKIANLKRKNTVQNEPPKKEVIAVGKIQKSKDESEILRQRLIDLYRENEESLKEYEIEQQEQQKIENSFNFGDEFDPTKPKDIVLYKNDGLVNNNEQELNDDFVELVTFRKSKNKAKLKSKIKKAAAVIAAGIICFMSTLGISKLFNKNYDVVEPKIDNIATEVVEETESIEDATKKVEEKIKQDIEQNTTKPETTNVESKTNYYDLDTSFKVEENSPIYTDMYKAADKVDGKKKYYSVDDLRTIDGLGIEYNGNMLSFIEVAGDENLYIVKGLGDNLYLTKDEANAKIKELIDKGAVVKSVLSKSNINEYEGFFSADNIDVGGIHR